MSYNIKTKDSIVHNVIKKIDDRTENKNSGSFTIHLKSKNKL